MRILTVKKPGNSSLVAVIVPVGSRTETNRIKGVSHFIEHLCFKGTQTRTAREIALAIEQYGGIINAYTGTEVTCYWAVVGNRYLTHAKKVIVDMVTNSTFPIREINKEREVVIQELKMYQDDPSSYVYDLFNKTFFQQIPNSGLAQSTIGTEFSLRSLSRRDILQYYREHYQEYLHRAEPTLLVIQGGQSVQYDAPILLTPERPLEEFGHVNFQFPTTQFVTESRADISQTALLLGKYQYTESEILTTALQLELLSAIFNTMSGRLFTTVREKNNLVYRVQFTSEIFTDGLIYWGVGLGLDSDKIPKARQLINQELTRPVTDTEIKTAVQHLLGRHALTYDNLSSLSQTIVGATLLGYDYRQVIDCQSYKQLLGEASKTVKQFQKDMNFQNNLTVGVLPK